MEGDDKEDEEAHAGCRRCDGCCCNVSLKFRNAYSYLGVSKLTIKEMPLQILRKAQMRRLQSILQLRKPIPVIFTFQIALDSVQRLLDSLQSGVEAGGFVESLEELGVLDFALGVLVADFAGYVVGGVVEDLDAAV